MKNNKYKKCDRCGEAYNVSPFHSMLGNGERADATIEIQGDVYDLCPKCTTKIYYFIHDGGKDK